MVLVIYICGTGGIGGTGGTGSTGGTSGTCDTGGDCDNGDTAGTGRTCDTGGTGGTEMYIYSSFCSHPYQFVGCTVSGTMVLSTTTPLQNFTGAYQAKDVQ